jgi:hypothetical protein
MILPPQDPFLCRILLYRNDAAEILLETHQDGLRLPVLAVPPHGRPAEEITAAIQSAWNVRTYCLFPLPASSLDHPFVRDHVVEACHPQNDSPATMQWFSVTSLSEGVFQTPSDFASIKCSLALLEQHRRNELPGAFGKPGWLCTVTEWVEAQANAAGLHLNGKFHQLNASTTFSLIRFETDNSALWFKAVGEPNLHEYRLTLKLSSIFPEYLPRVVAARHKWNAWLTVESDGTSLEATPSSAAWSVAAENLALLQMSSFDRRFELIKTGCKDFRPGSVVHLIDPFFEAVAELMERQVKPSPAPLTRCELRSLSNDIASSVEDLGACAVPNTLGHLDMNAGNLIVSARNCIFLDWAEGYIGPPFLSAQYLLEQLRRLHGPDSLHERSVRSVYTRTWTRFVSPSEIDFAFDRVPLVAAFLYAAGSGAWRKPDCIRPESAGLLRSLARRMKREADALQARRPPCPL